MQELSTTQATAQAHGLIAEAYRDLRLKVRAYIIYRINNIDDADDLTQDVFVRLLEYGQTIRRETMQHMVFTVARNIVTDYLRRYYRAQEVMEDYLETAEECSDYSQSILLANDLAKHEELRVGQLPAQRQAIYRMVRFEDRRPEDIAVELNLSIRTVENHLCIGRRKVREYIRQII